jgi:hypothetical protein
MYFLRKTSLVTKSKPELSHNKYFRPAHLGLTRRPPTPPLIVRSRRPSRSRSLSTPPTIATLGATPPPFATAATASDPNHHTRRPPAALAKIDALPGRCPTPHHISINAALGKNEMSSRRTVRRSLNGRWRRAAIHHQMDDLRRASYIMV